MAKIAQNTISEWIERADEYLTQRKLTRTSILTGSDAWTLASILRISHEAYDIGPDIVDAHIQTALRAVFPNAVFRDKCHY